MPFLYFDKQRSDKTHLHITIDQELDLKSFKLNYFHSNFTNHFPEGILKGKCNQSPPLRPL